VRRPRRNHSPAFKAKVALAALKGDESLTVLAERFDLHANQITSWKNQLVEQAAAVFAAEAAGDGGPPIDIKALHAKIGQQALEIDFLAGALGRLPGPSAKR
jgi:transposase